jgi:hypothetical protein
MFLNCPAYLDQDRALRCGLPAEVRCRFTMRSTDGPIECAMIRCPAGHHFNGAIESLTWDSSDNHDPGPAVPDSRAGRDSLQRDHDGRSGLALRNFPARPERNTGRPNTAPAYYLGHPASLWIIAMRPQRPGTRPALRTSRKSPPPSMADRSKHSATTTPARPTSLEVDMNRIRRFAITLAGLTAALVACHAPHRVLVQGSAIWFRWPGAGSHFP